MTLIELKESLHQKIEDVSDEHVLEQVAAILDKQQNMHIIPEHIMPGIERGLDDIKNGRVHSSADFDNEFAEWLKE